jgi:small subunit ribosomal protein S20
MPTHKSAEKRVRQTARRTDVNRTRRTKIRSFVKKVESAIAAGDKQAAASALREAQPVIMRGVNQGVMKMNAAARKVSRLSARVKAMTA